jgi:hypothetical protein
MCLPPMSSIGLLLHDLSLCSLAVINKTKKNLSDQRKAIHIKKHIMKSKKPIVIYTFLEQIVYMNDWHFQINMMGFFCVQPVLK